MGADAAQRIVTVFRSRLREGAEDNGYPQLAADMEARAASMPGFVEFKTFVAGDGERVSIVVFESLEEQQAWRQHPEHRAAQDLGRERFYSEYTVTVCTELRTRTFRSATAP